jgi:hypothetical protein
MNLGKFKQKGNPFANRANRSSNPFRHATGQEHDQTIPGHEAGIDERSGLDGYDYTNELTSVVGESEKIMDKDGLGGYTINTPTDYTNTMTGVFAGGGEEVIDTGGGTPPNNNPNGLSQEELNQNFISFCELNPNSPKCDKFYNRKPATDVNEDDVYSYSNQEIDSQYFPGTDPVPDPPKRFSGGFDGGGGYKSNQLGFEIKGLDNMNLNQLRRAKKKCGDCKSAGLINVLLGRRSG